MKSGKAQGTDSITADLLKADTDTTVHTLHGLLQQQQQQHQFICTHTTISREYRLPKITIRAKKNRQTLRHYSTQFGRKKVSLNTGTKGLPSRVGKSSD